MRIYEAQRQCNGKPLSTIAKESGIKYRTIENRWYHGCRTYEELTRPVKYNRLDENHLDCCTDKGRRLLKAIADSGLTINQVCKRCGVSNSTVTKFAHDDTRITAILLAKLCGTVGVSMDYVMGLRREK
jgi:lambda repressor-like predicted transcriptional regulator